MKMKKVDFHVYSVSNDKLLSFIFLPEAKIL